MTALEAFPLIHSLGSCFSRKIGTRAKDGCTRLTSCIYSSAGPFVNTACCSFFYVPSRKRGTIDHCTVCYFNVIRHVLSLLWPLWRRIIITSLVERASHTYYMTVNQPRCNVNNEDCTVKKGRLFPFLALCSLTRVTKPNPGFTSYKPAFLDF